MVLRLAVLAGDVKVRELNGPATFVATVDLVWIKPLSMASALVSRQG